MSYVLSRTNERGLFDSILEVASFYGHYLIMFERCPIIDTQLFRQIKSKKIKLTFFFILLLLSSFVMSSFYML